MRLEASSQSEQPIAVQMDTLRSVEERLLDEQEFYGHEVKEADEMVKEESHVTVREGILASATAVRDGGWLRQRPSLRLSQRLKTLMPSFATAAGRKQHCVVQSQLKATSYMDGLRGVACWCVFVGHVWRPWTNYPNNDDNWDFGFDSMPGPDMDLVRFPIIRAIYSGTFMVQIFFILSGYVLSLKPLSLIRSQNHDLLLEYLSAAAFRRVFRLFIPVAAARFFVCIMIYIGKFGTNFIGVDYEQPKESLWLQLADYCSVLMGELNPFRWDRDQPPYMAQLWTIAVEFRGSIVVYIILLTMANIRPTVRITTLCAFVIYCMSSVRMWDIADFVCGMLLAEASLIRKDSDFDLFYPLRGFVTSRALQKGRAIFWTFCNIIALWLGTYPLRDGFKAWSYVTFSKLIPSAWQEGGWWQATFSIFLGSVLLLTALENYKPLQRPYTTVIAQYLGKISFSLYVVHQPLAFCFNRWIAQFVFAAIPVHLIAYCISMALVSFTTLWAADVFWRLVDVKSISMARSIRKWCEIR